MTPTDDVVRALIERLGNDERTGPLQHTRGWDEHDRLQADCVDALSALLSDRTTADVRIAALTVERDAARDALRAEREQVLEGPSEMRRTVAAMGAAPEPGPVLCEQCQGNGEVVTDWDRYLHARPGDKGDEAVAECPDCNGEGETAPEPGA